MQKLIFDVFRNRALPVYQEQPGGNGTSFPEVMKALTGSPSTIVRVSEKNEQIVSVAVPIQRFRAVLGVLMLSTEGGDIDKIVAAERKAILRVFGIAALVTALLSLLLASTIANPLRRLSAAAVRVRRGVKNREEIPDFSDRQDEIGNLSIAVRDMTNALYARIEAGRVRNIGNEAVEAANIVLDDVHQPAARILIPGERQGLHRATQGS